MHYKDPKNNLHFIEPEFAHLLPEGCIAITQEEADAIVASKVIPLTHQELRAIEYPSFADQFDLLYHGGMDAWKTAIQTVKAKYPKV